jgi:type I restriction enzyme, S subunit
MSAAEWKVRSFGEFCRQSAVLNGAREDLPPLSVTKSNGVVLQSTKFKKRIAIEDTSRYKVLVRGQFVYDPMSLYYGAIGWQKCADRGIVSPAYITFDVDDSVSSDFFWHLVTSKEVQNEFVARTEGGNFHGKRKKTDWAAFSSVTLPMPPLAEQRKIAGILGSVDEAIRATQAVIEQTRAVKQGLLEALLTRGIGHHNFQRTVVGDVPAHWRVVSLSEISTVERGRFSARPRNDPSYYGGDIPFVQTGDVSRASGVLTEYTQTLNERGLAVSKLFPAGTILVTIAANIGDVAVAKFPVAFPDSLVGVRAGPGVDVGWLRYYLSHSKQYLESKATQNAQKNINLQVLEPMPVALPPLGEQLQIRESLDSVEQTEAHALLGIQDLRRLKLAIMQQLLSGRVRVSVD